MGLGAPKDTPTDIVDRLNRETNAALADPTIKARLADFGGTIRESCPPTSGGSSPTETEKWGKVVTFAGLKPD